MKLEWRNLYTICILFITAIFISFFVNSAVNTNMYTEKISTHKYIYDKNIEKLQINNRSQ